MIGEDFWSKFKPKTRVHGYDLPFYQTGLTGDFLNAWQQQHPGQQYMTPEEMENIQSMATSGTMTAATMDPFQSMASRGSRKKKRRGEPDPPRNTLFGTMGGGIGGLFGGG